MDNIHCLPVMLWMMEAGRFLITSHKRSITFSNVWKASFLNPRLRISFQICSIGFISGVYGWMKIIQSCGGRSLCEWSCGDFPFIVQGLHNRTENFSRPFRIFGAGVCFILREVHAAACPYAHRLDLHTDLINVLLRHYPYWL